MLNNQHSIFNVQVLLNKPGSPLIVAIRRQKNIGYRIVFTRFPNISLLRIPVNNFKNINFNTH